MSAQLIERFYRGFVAKDAATMASCYHPDARFSDPVFPDLDRAHVAAMWRMFCAPDSGSNLRVEFSAISGDDKAARAHWDAHYDFPATKRKVLNRIDASFEIRDGLIYRHRDSFDFWKWTRMALGPAGVLLGWTPIVQNKVRAQAAARLESFLRRESGTS